MLPDFFVDHFVSLDTVENTCNAVKTVAAQGGGNLTGSHSGLLKGEMLQIPLLHSHDLGSMLI